MPDETKESLEAKEAVTPEDVTDAELDSASEVVGEKKPEVKQDEIEDEPLDHRERSRLGRRVKSLEDGITNLIEKMDGYFLQRMDDRVSVREEPESEIPEVVTTKDDVLKVLQYNEDQKQRAQVDYERKYLQETRGFQKVEGESYKEIFDEMYANFNIISTGNPKIDARMNWLNAKNAVLSKKLSGFSGKKKVNLKGDKTPVSTNLSVESNVDEAPAPNIQLDEYAADFVKKTKMKESSVKDALKGEIGIHLAGRK